MSYYHNVDCSWPVPAVRRMESDRIGTSTCHLLAQFLALLETACWHRHRYDPGCRSPLPFPADGVLARRNDFSVFALGQQKSAAWVKKSSAATDQANSSSILPAPWRLITLRCSAASSLAEPMRRPTFLTLCFKTSPMYSPIVCMRTPMVSRLPSSAWHTDLKPESMPTRTNLPQ